MKWEASSMLYPENTVYFFVKTNNPRPTFHLDINADERGIMNRHVEYWTELARQGISVVFGPVADPHGFYGIGVYKVEDEAQMQGLLDEDPAKGLLVYEATPMANAVVGHSVRYPDLP
jgi:hypothetical protein